MFGPQVLLSIMAQAWLPYCHNPDQKKAFFSPRERCLWPTKTKADLDDNFAIHTSYRSESSSLSLVVLDAWMEKRGTLYETKPSFWDCSKTQDIKIISEIEKNQISSYFMCQTLNRAGLRQPLRKRHGCRIIDTHLFRSESSKLAWSL